MIVDYKSITLDDARKAIRAYNASCYTDRRKSTEIDEKARALFQNGLAPTLAEIERQVHFIAVDYGGIAGFKAATALIPEIARDIYDIRDRYADRRVFESKDDCRSTGSRASGNSSDLCRNGWRDYG